MVKHILGFSGGIDSQAAAGVLLDHYGHDDVIFLNSDAGGNEDALTTEHVEWYSANVHPVIPTNAIYADVWETPGFAETKGFDSNAALSFEALLGIKRRPVASAARYCTAILKLKPQRRWIQENFGPTGQFAGLDFERYTGVRRDESASRANTPDREFDDFFNCYLNHIIAAWPKQRCFDFIQARGERVNELYRMGFNRVGCAPCALCAKEDIANWAIRRPENIDKIRGWEERTGITFFQPIRQGKGKSINGVDEVVNWACNPKRGGSRDQPLFPILMERTSCESKYGLCE